MSEHNPVPEPGPQAAQSDVVETDEPEQVSESGVKSKRARVGLFL